MTFNLITAGEIFFFRDWKKKVAKLPVFFFFPKNLQTLTFTLEKTYPALRCHTL